LSMLLYTFLLFFFFQAEDGIRDSSVTGVQTCALPILIERLRREGVMDQTIIVATSASDPAPLQYLAPYAGAAIGEWFRDNKRHRSEERRVGKEWRCCWLSYGSC